MPSSSSPFASMNPAGTLKLVDLPEAESTLRELCRPFVHPDDFAPQCVVLQPAEIPYPQDQLLVHHGHMTEVLERHHGAAVRVHVLEEHLDGDVYTRKIALTPTGSDGKVVEWGIVRLDFRYMSPELRDEILAKQTPLGALLIKHDVLRRIKPRWFLRFPPGGPVLKWFGAPAEGSEPLYGRIGTIYCNEEPAIELLEIVLNCDNGQAGTMTGPVHADVDFGRDSSRMA